MKKLLDAQPEDEAPNLLAFLVLVPPGLAVEDAMNNLDPEVRRTLAAAGCAQDVESVAEGDGPSTITFAAEGSTDRVDWTSVPGAEYYRVYFGNVQDCYVDRAGGALGCEVLASNVPGTTYVHEGPHQNASYYWVSACDAGGCSFIYEERSARFAGGTPASPSNLRYEREGASAILSWDPSGGATHYKVFFDGFGDMRCSISRSGLALGCQELDTNVTQTNYVHDGAGSAPSYWVVACNRGGCSEVDSENPAPPIVDRPDSPADAVYAVEGSTIRLSWEAAAGADSYTVYYDDFSDTGCRLGYDGSPSFCDELATDVAATSYVHTDPSSRENHYWVVACNRGGCSEIDSGNPARPDAN